MIEYSISIFLVVPIYTLIHFYARKIHRNEYWVYLIVLIISIINTLLLAFNVELPIGLNWIQNGNITFAMFTIVMFGGVLKKKTTPYKTVLQVRRELAITGFILLIPHAVLRLDLALGGYNFTGIIAAIIMVPLVITSFTFIRKK
ncbi:MAG: hypothetical protein K9L74_06140 [Candidatus Izimaplasma sp.]|nr:hypothetical protein [Candidatus Izimaplasma bacterium]